ncbi:MAG: hypothetical protein ACOYOH_12670 [Paracraurococcus sp.]
MADGSGGELTTQVAALTQMLPGKLGGADIRPEALPLEDEAEPAPARPGPLEAHILALRESLEAALAATAEARQLAARRAETIAELEARLAQTDSALATAREATVVAVARTRRALRERDEARSGMAAARSDIAALAARTLALANRRNWEIVAHAAQLAEARALAEAARGWPWSPSAPTSSGRRPR